uniref:Small-subunit processome Utp12 domain-containing protein n=1 Tax=Strombidium inclinatum TaxID=197538 RepID=A0A7S3MWE7_9SPIT|mmetsp:Transcript_20948/g.32448  ORF Transcript_20948/g.32448 Transcript_20948/m.32448 type:complete len:249 (+) Transcript_20948:2111-2857(+)
MMPGSKKPNNAQIVKRNTKLAIRVKKVLFSPDGTQFACATTEGLLVYSLEPNTLQQTTFNPMDIDESVTLDNIIGNIKKENYLTALVLSLKMNEQEVIEKVFKCIPAKSAPLIAANFPSAFFFQFLEFICTEIEKTRDVEWNLIWLKELIKYNDHVLKGCRLSAQYQQQAFSMSQLHKYQVANQNQNMKGRAVLLKMYQILQFYDGSLKRIVNENMHLMKFITARSQKVAATAVDEEEDEHLQTMDTV